MLIGHLALVLASLFTGAAFYVNFAEQPARLQLDDRSLLAEWKPSYQHGFVMQASLAMLGFLLGAVAWWQTGLAAFLARRPLYPGALALDAPGHQAGQRRADGDRLWRRPDPKPAPCSTNGTGCMPCGPCSARPRSFAFSLPSPRVEAAQRLDGTRSAGALMPPRGDLAGRLAATLNKSLKGRARRTRADPGLLAAARVRVFLLPAVGIESRSGADQWPPTKTATKSRSAWRPATQARARGHAAQPVRRDLGSHLPQLRLRLAQRRAGRGALQGRRGRLRL